MTSRPLETCVLGLTLRHPVLLGSGPLTDSRVRIRKAFEAGVAGVVCKTIYRGEFPDVDERVRQLATGALNSTTYSRRPEDEWLDILSGINHSDTPVIASIHAGTSEELGDLARRVAETRCPAIELGIACPNDGSQQGLTAHTVFELTKAVRSCVCLPVSVKLAAVDDFVDQAHAAVEAGADAISISDTLPAIALDIERQRFAFSGPVGYSGLAIKPLVLHAIYRLRQTGLKCPIIGIGGIQGTSDVLEYLQVGASATQVYTAVMKQGLDIIEDIVAGLARWCMEHNTTISDLVGSALERKL